MLKDSLKALSEEAEKYVECRIGRLMQDFDPETLEVFKSVMRGRTSSRSIWNALKKSGITVDRAAIDKARPCFRNEVECPCEKRSSND